MISSSQRPLSDNTQQSQQTNIHVPGGIRTRNLSRRAVTDLCLRPRGYWDRQKVEHYIVQTQIYQHMNIRELCRVVLTVYWFIRRVINLNKFVFTTEALFESGKICDYIILPMALNSESKVAFLINHIYKQCFCSSYITYWFCILVTVQETRKCFQQYKVSGQERILLWFDMSL